MVSLLHGFMVGGCAWPLGWQVGKAKGFWGFWERCNLAVGAGVQVCAKFRFFALELGRCDWRFVHLELLHRMKIEIQNLGPIHHFEFDLEKDLHLLYGENNVGKSVAVTTLYLFLKSVQISGDRASIKQTFRPEVKDYDVGYMMFEDAFKYFFERTALSAFEHQLTSTYSGNAIGSFFKSNQTVFVFTLSNDIELVVAINSFGDYKLEDFSIPTPIDVSDVNEAVVEVFAEILHTVNSKIKEVFFLPSSRSGLYPVFSQLSRIYIELSKHRLLLKDKSIDLMPLSPSMANYFLNLSQIDNKVRSQDLERIAKEIEEKLFHGMIKYNIDVSKITYHPTNSKSEVDLLNAASMISELAPLVLYLKFIIEPNKEKPSLLIIEEPEAHLHPKVQVQLMEIFAELTKHNVKVILTSHSNYMFNKLSNMLLKKEIAPEKVGVYHMVMTDKGSVVAPDMQATTQGIEDHNFADVAKELYQERLETYDLLNEDPDAAE
jgi:AAA15 family ATPase/GTPase